MRRSRSRFAKSPKDQVSGCDIILGTHRVLDVLQPYIDDLARRKERGARRAAADIAIAVLSGLYGCREDTKEDMLLVRMGLPGAADDRARMVYEKVKPLQLVAVAGGRVPRV